MVSTEKGETPPCFCQAPPGVPFISLSPPFFSPWKPIHFFNFFFFSSVFSLLLPVSSSNFSLESLCFSFSPWDATGSSIVSL